MPPISRSSHIKSRNGCQRCKKRHVKCDEQQPCRNCLRHNAECSLLWTRKSVVPSVIAPRISNLTSQNLSVNASPRPILSHSQESGSQQSPGVAPGLPLSPLSRLSMISNLVQELAAEIQNDTPRIHSQTATKGNPADTSPHWMTNLKLLNHYATSTCLTLHHDSATLHFWRVEVPGLAVSNEALMHGLLAISALHYAHTHPNERQSFIRESTYHQDRAVEFFLAKLTALDDDSREPFFILAIFIFMLETWLIANPQNPSELTSLQTVWRSFALVQGIQTIFDCPSKDLSKGLLSPLFDRSEIPPIDPSRPFAKRLEQIGRLVEDIDANNIESLELCRDGFNSLKNAYSRHRSPQISQPRMWMWRVEMRKKRFNLTSHHPVGIVILAHCAALVRCAEGPSWLWDGWSEHVLEMAVREIDPEWRDWLQWPLRCVRNALDVDVST